MRTRDPETKRRLILEAALSEFAEHGLAGARLERLAKRAGVSAGLIYSFHPGKGELFEAVFDVIVEQSVSEAPIDATDLPQYAGTLYDLGLAYPEVGRFMMWYQLERGDAPQRASVAAAMADKVAAIQRAQGEGLVDTRYSAAQLLALILTISAMWQESSESTLSLVPIELRRVTVVEAVRDLVNPGRQSR